MMFCINECMVIVCVCDGTREPCTRTEPTTLSRGNPAQTGRHLVQGERSPSNKPYLQRVTEWTLFFLHGGTRPPTAPALTQRRYPGYVHVRLEEASICSLITFHKLCGPFAREDAGDLAVLFAVRALCRAESEWPLRGRLTLQPAKPPDSLKEFRSTPCNKCARLSAAHPHAGRQQLSPASSIAIVQLRRYTTAKSDHAECATAAWGCFIPRSQFEIGPKRSRQGSSVVRKACERRIHTSQP